MTNPATKRLPLFFPKGLIGYPEWRRFHLEWLQEDDPVAVLQSDDAVDVWFYVTAPELVLPAYSVAIDPALREALDLGQGQEPTTLCVLVVRDEPLTITANLLGPILYNPENGLAYQVVLQDTNYSPRYPVPRRPPTAELTPCSY